MKSKLDSAIFRPDLGAAAHEYMEGDTMGMIGLQLMPIFRTPVASGGYPVITKETLMKIQETARAPKSAYNRGDWVYERGTFSTSEEGWEEPIDDTERELFDLEAPGEADYVATQRAVNILARGLENEIAGKLFNSTNFTAHSITHEWDDATNAVPISDVNTGKAAFRLQCGMLPDTLTIAYSTFLNLLEVDQIIDRLKYTFPMVDYNQMGSVELAHIFNVPRVLIGGAVKDTGGGGQDASISDIWDSEYALLSLTGNGRDLREPSIGRTFLWTVDSPNMPVVEQYREEQIRSDVFRVRQYRGCEFIASKNKSGSVVSNISAACGYLFSNITT
jgi:hypothetical protein